MICCRLTHLIWLRLLSGCHIQPFQYSTFLPLFLLQVCLWPSIGSRGWLWFWEYSLIILMHRKGSPVFLFLRSSAGDCGDCL